MRVSEIEAKGDEMKPARTIFTETVAKSSDEIVPRALERTVSGPFRPFAGGFAGTGMWFRGGGGTHADFSASGAAT